VSAALWYRPPVRTIVVLALFAAVSLLGCKKPVPKMVTPVEVDAPRMDQAALDQSQAAQDHKSGSVKLSYCVGVDGKTHDVAVVEAFDPEIDALAVKTIEGWTFQPATRDGEPYDFCTDVTFDLRF
jgi:TonB family protein